MPETRTTDIIRLTAGITAAYAAGNHLPASALPDVLTTVHGALCGLERKSAQTVDVATPARALDSPSLAQIRQSIRDEGLTSFIDGKPYKTLKRHLTAHGLTPDGYRARYGLPADYPMTAPGYAAKRSALAKAIGLGVPGAQAKRRAAA